MSFGVLRFGVLGIGLSVLAACVAPPPSEPCAQAEACQVSQLIVQDMRRDVGRDFGGGLVLRNVEVAGSLVVMDLEIPIPARSLEEVQKRALHSVAAQGFVDGFCGDPDSEEVFMFGNAFQMRSFGNDGGLIGASTIRSCRG